jgi:hypothetical protein
MSTTQGGPPPGGLPDLIELDGVICFQKEGEPDVWSYIPGSPTPEMVNGRPTLALFVSATGGTLQMGARWGLTSQQLETLKAEIARRRGVPAGQVGLQPAPATVRSVSVEVGEGSGPFESVASAKSSGFSPFNTIFRVQLDVARKNAVVAALNEREGFLAVRFRIATSVKISARVVVEGDIAGALRDLSPDASEAEVAEWLDKAIEEARVSLLVEPLGDAAEDLIYRARQLGIDNFARALRAKLRGARAKVPEESTLRVEAVASGMVSRELERVADVSKWFPGGTGKDHITVLPGGDPGPTPTPTDVVVGIGFPFVELPVAFVEARAGNEKALLRPPRFEPVHLKTAEPQTNIQLTTRYTTGAASYSAQVTTGRAAQLGPAELGLTQITVDGQARREAGAKRIDGQLRAVPGGADRTFSFSGQHWTVSFFLVTRGEPLAGEFELEWTEEFAQGPPARRQMTAKDQTTVVLQEHQSAKEPNS